MEGSDYHHLPGDSDKSSASFVRVPQGKGFSLMEVLVASALLLLLMSILLQFSTSGYRITHEEFERNTAEATILVLSTQFARDLELTSPAGLSIDATGSTVVMHPLTLADTGSIVYKDQFLGWHHNSTDSTVKRCVSDGVPGFPFTGEAVRLDQPYLSTLPTSSEFLQNRLFPKIENFQLSNPAGVVAPFVGSPLTLNISVALDRARTRKNIKFERTYHLRTSGL